MTLSNIESQYVSTVFKHTMLAIKNDAITNQIIRFGIYEREIIEFILKLLQKIEKPIIFDVGANIGNHSLAFSLFAEQVYSFEPTVPIYQFLRQNIFINNIKNINAVNKGLSDKNIESYININTTGNVGASSIGIQTENYVKDKIHLIKGDSFVDEFKIQKVDLIKIDVEGHELFAIKGLNNTIEKFRPIVIMEWVNNIEEFSNENALENLFQDYQVFSIGFNFNNNLNRNNYLDRVLRVIYKKLCLAKVKLFKFPDYKRNDILLIPKEKLFLLDK